MKTIHKKPRSSIRKGISLFGKIALLMMGEQIPKSNVAKMQQTSSKKRPVYLKILFLILKLPLIVLLAGLKNRKPRKPDLQEIVMGEPIPMSDDYYIPDDKY